MEDHRMKEELGELKTGQKLLEYRADQTDKVIVQLTQSVDKLHGDIKPLADHLKWMVRLGLFYVISDTVGLDNAFKLLPKLVGM